MIKAPFPYFGSKSKAAPLIWSRLGNVPNYVDPFAGSLAVLLARPHEPGIETVNDKDCMISNFWRAIQKDPEQVAKWADWPVSEVDLYARHKWLIGAKHQLENDPNHCNFQLAGWWVWGLSSWIGGGWCSYLNNRRPCLNSAGQGINRRRPCLNSAGINRHIGDTDTGKGLNKKQALIQTFQTLADRLRNVRVCNGDWSRIMGPSVTFKHGITGVVLDPPYTAEAGRDPTIYVHDDLSVGHDVAKWGFENGDNPKLRIALCGYEGEYVVPSDWTTGYWKANSGMAGNKNLNRKKERVWFSPHCLKVQQELFV